MRVALVYDRLNKVGGAESVLIEFSKLFPHADWYTSFWDPSSATFSSSWHVHSFPYLHQHHEWFPWVMPFIFESYDFSSYDLVISIGSAEAKGIITRPGTFHLHYCLTPTRYLYSHAREYLSNPLYRFIAHFLRRWDLVASTRPDEMIAISTHVKNRIKKYYKRNSLVIFPPVDTKRFSLTGTRENRITGLPNDYFLVVSRLVPYKKIEILVQAANLSGKSLVIIGEGSEQARLQRLAGPTVHFLGHVDDQYLPRYYANCLAYLQATEEDFGIAMCEAQSAGKPVIAYGQGGVTDIIKHGITGILVELGTVAGFKRAMMEFDPTAFSSSVCRNNAARFDQAIWKKTMQQKLQQVCR